MNGFGEAIKSWRKSRGLSQMDLGLSANISSKHISFLENGRAKPSREMIVLLCNSMGIPLAERNMLFKLAGYTDAYSRMSIEQEEMSAVRGALQMILDNHAPYPAMVLDWHCNILMSNDPFREVLQFIIDRQENFPTTNNIIEMIFHPNGVRPLIDNWEEVASVWIHRIQGEQLIRNESGFNLLEKIRQYPGVPEQWNVYDPTRRTQPMVHFGLRVGDACLKLFSTVASFGTAVDVTMQELIIEQYFPVDEFTENFFKGM